MATVTQRVAEVDNGRAFIELTYDDVTEVVTRIAWANNAGRPVLCTFRRPNGVMPINKTLAPGEANSVGLTGGARFNRADTWSFNLAT